ncbi:MAG: hypothetical protein A2W93_00110 [Bacteroidetes bacterium GWF2_43_63]|nr:MAG: hypothetical protein A2W94_11380 [Bacteroidetes bacterium GWE2_42_42]OFY52684.1 MAG: hypothetical protein A2W93_00110 [Bacteroidetes bacterium GWF2_43_63]HBG69304.1 hypothetical protein [Bacteroidales bacterium]HCB60358.1 hypothetical protein [Bacteroidales bacterium]HCY23655.1 hypothetical protein [Bacteroidales bacterium]
MKKSFISFVLILFSVAIFAQVKYTSPLGNFTITFPGSPEYQNSDVDITDGSVKLHMFIYTGSNEVFMVACADYPSEYLSSEESRTIFIDNAAEGFFGELNITPGNRQDVKAGKYKGAEFRGQGVDYGVFYRVYIAGNTVFQVAIMNSGAYPEEKAAKSFFKSFKVTK